MRPTLLFLSALAAVLLLPGARPAERPAPAWTFGLSLATGPGSEPYSLFLVHADGNQLLAAEPITRSRFVQEVQGAVKSKANPSGENLFRTHRVSACVHPYDSTFIVPDCSPFDELWKLRFWDYPFHVTDARRGMKGWSSKEFMPGQGQLAMLADHGIHTLTGLTWGEPMFRLLRNVTDSAWVDLYRRAN
jgi:hypothetical protein